MLIAVGGAHLGAVSMSAADAVRTVVLAKLGGGVDVTVETVGVKGDSPVFREARPDPSARLGQPMRFTLVTDAGAALPITATVRVVGRRVVTRRDIGRGELVTAADVGSLEEQIVGVPLRRLPTTDDVVGSRAIRAIAAGSTVQATYVALRRVIEQGDAVTVVAAAGAVEVTAAMVAADGGRTGDVIRVVNPDTKRYLRGRIVKEGLVEVIDGR